MAEPITIGGQTFIKSEDGWIDKKTKVRAPEGLTTLLEKMSLDNTPQEKKKRVRIDTSRPVVKLGKSEYVWDLNGKTWIDKKTKDPVSPRFSALVEAAYNKISKSDFLYEESAPQPTKEESEAAVKKHISEAIFSNTGTVGQAAKTKAKKPTGGGTLRRGNKRINSPIILMIEKLANIDGLLKQRLQGQIAAANSASIQSKENTVESNQDAVPVLDQEQADAEAQEQDKKSNAAMMVVAAGAGALFLSQLDPVKETFSAIIDFAKSVWSFTSSAVGYINDGLRRIVGNNSETGKSGEASSATGTGTGSSTTPATDASPVQSDQSSVPSSSGSQEDDSNTPFPNNEYSTSGESSTSSSTGATQPDEITTPFPNNDPEKSASPTSSPTSSSGSSTAAKTIIGSIIGGIVAGPIGSLVGGAIGFFSSPSSTSSEESTSGGQSQSSQPTQADASPVGGNTQASSGTSAVRARDVIAFTARSGDESHFNLLEQETKNAVLAAAAEYKQETGRKLTLNSGRRTNAEQWALWNNRHNNSNPVAYPGTSNHESGWSVDIGQAGDPVAKRILEKHGMVWYGARDPVHYTLRGHGDSSGGSSGAGSADSGASDSNPLQAAASTAWDMAGGAISALAAIAKAGLGAQVSRSLSDSLMRGPDGGPLAAAINKAETERTGDIAEARTSEDKTQSSVILDPPNISRSGGGTIENAPTSSDYAGVFFYLSRQYLPNMQYNAHGGNIMNA